MNNQLKRALLPVASFHIVNPAGGTEKKLCLFPGHFDTIGAVPYTDASQSAAVQITFDNIQPIINAGYFCDQMADDLNPITPRSAVQVSSNSARTRYHDFLNYIKLMNLRVSKIRLTNRTGEAGRAQFLKEMEISASAIGSRAASDFINLAQYKNPANFDQDVIEIDLDQRNLLLDATTLGFLNIAVGADFDIEFTLDDQPLVVA